VVERNATANRARDGKGGRVAPLAHKNAKRRSGTRFDAYRHPFAYAAAHTGNRELANDTLAA